MTAICVICAEKHLFSKEKQSNNCGKWSYDYERKGGEEKDGNRNKIETKIFIEKIVPFCILFSGILKYFWEIAVSCGAELGIDIVLWLWHDRARKKGGVFYESADRDR